MEQVIGKVIDRTFKSMESLYRNEDIDAISTRLCFPQYYHGVNENELRLSEQELRQMFVEEFNRYCDEKKLGLRYSVETPTKDKYRNNKPSEDGGRSGRFDLTIFDDERMVAIIEFKSFNVDYERDLGKLTNEKEGGTEILRYLVNVLKTADQGTVKSITEKFSKNLHGERKVYLRFYSLENPEINEDFPQFINY